MRTLLTLLLAGALCAHEPVRARKAMVVAQEPIATDVGVEILKRGGNAYDAAVAVAFSLAVTRIWSCMDFVAMAKGALCISRCQYRCSDMVVPARRQSR